MLAYLSRLLQSASAKYFSRDTLREDIFIDFPRLPRAGTAAALLCLPSAVYIAQPASADTSDRTANPVYMDQVTQLAKDYIASFTADQRSDIQYPFYDKNRLQGRDTENTENFCASVIWCKPWGIGYCQLSDDQKTALNAVMETALGSAGYQTILSIWRLNLILGEMEDIGNARYAAEVAKLCPDLRSASVFDIPEHCRPASYGDQQPATLGGGMPPDKSGEYEIKWAPPTVPGLIGRHKDACEYALAVFGEPGSDAWSLRFEGHHVSVNLTYLRKEGESGYTVDATPLFLGAVPAIVPPPPADVDDETLWSWSAGMSLFGSQITNIRNFISSLPETVIEDSWFKHDDLSAAPFVQNTPPTWLETGLTDHPSAITGAIKVKVSTMSEEAKYFLSEFYKRFFETMPTSAAERKTRYLKEILADEEAEISIAWSGQKPLAEDGNVFLQVIVGSLLVEALTSFEWSTVVPHTPESNHFHAIMRDLDFEWDHPIDLYHHAHPHPH